MEKLLFKNWDSLWHVAVCSIISYLALFVFIRISVKRTLAKLNAFDFVVAVTLGSTLSAMMLGSTTVLRSPDIDNRATVYAGLPLQAQREAGDGD
jgi:uncharacterized membrane protein YwaF